VKSSLVSMKLKVMLFDDRVEGEGLKLVSIEIEDDFVRGDALVFFDKS
jgi:hypothetical protein